MLDIAKKQALPGLPNVIVYGDDTDDDVFYALSAVPRVALESDGSPQIGLILYGKGEGSAFSATGGILTLTLDIAVSDGERERATQLLRNQSGSGARIIVAPTVHAQFSARLPGGVTLHGQSDGPSPRCSFSQKLEAVAAQALDAAWQRGLAGSIWAKYELTLERGPAQFGFSFSQNVVERDGERMAATSAAQHASAPRQQSLTGEGSVAVSGTPPRAPLRVTL